MGLKKSTIIKAVSAAFKAAGEIVSSATYRRTVTTYVPSTGLNTKTNTDYTIPIIFTGFSNYEIDRQLVQAFDIKGIVEEKDLSVTPNPATDTVIYGSKVYNIIRYIQDPAGATYTLHLRGV